MMRIKDFAPALSLYLPLSILLAAAAAHAEAGPEFRDLQSQAMGRTGIASPTGATSLFLNPAAPGRAAAGAARGGFVVPDAAGVDGGHVRETARSDHVPSAHVDSTRNTRHAGWKACRGRQRTETRK